MTKRLFFMGLWTVIALALIGTWVLSKSKPNVNIQSSYNPPVVDMTEDETVQWLDSVRAAGYNVDIKIPKAHAWDRHGADATDAIKCLSRNGTAGVLSEKGNRNLHLLCVDPETGSAYVVIIERIRRYADTLQTATSRLITAFKLTDVTLEQYVTWETSIKCIVVRLSFYAGELFFTP